MTTTDGGMWRKVTRIQRSEWKTIAGKDYCFGPDGYLFVECYIKSEVNNILLLGR